MVVGVRSIWSIPLRWVLKPKSLSSFLRTLEVFPQSPWVFFPKHWSFEDLEPDIWKKPAVFCRKFVLKVPNIAFFRCAWRKYGQFWLICSQTQEIEWVLKFTWLLSLPVCWVLTWKILEFFRKCLKKARTKVYFWFWNFVWHSQFIHHHEQNKRKFPR